MSFIRFFIAVFIVFLSSNSAFASVNKGFYTKLAIGYGSNFNNKNINEEISIHGGAFPGRLSVKKKGTIGELALGYYLDKNLAGEVAFVTNPAYEVNYSQGNLSKYKIKNYLLNLNYYINFDSKITPFITGGLGLGRVDCKDILTSKKGKKSGLARMIGVGVMLPIKESFSTELTYKISSSGIGIVSEYSDKSKVIFNQALSVALRLHF
jgi:opacity protein-like surface antigen